MSERNAKLQPLPHVNSDSLSYQGKNNQYPTLHLFSWERYVQMKTLLPNLLEKHHLCEVYKADRHCTQIFTILGGK